MLCGCKVCERTCGCAALLHLDFIYNSDQGAAPFFYKEKVISYH